MRRVVNPFTRHPSTACLPMPLHMMQQRLLSDEETPINKPFSIPPYSAKVIGHTSSSPKRPVKMMRVPNDELDSFFRELMKDEPFARDFRDKIGRLSLPDGFDIDNDIYKLFLTESPDGIAGVHAGIVGNAPVGFASLIPERNVSDKYDVSQDGDALMLSQYHISSYQGVGVGSRLQPAAVNEALKAGYTVYCHIEQANKASVRLMEKTEETFRHYNIPHSFSTINFTDDNNTEWTRAVFSPREREVFNAQNLIVPSLEQRLYRNSKSFPQLFTKPQSAQPHHSSTEVRQAGIATEGQDRS